MLSGETRLLTRGLRTRWHIALVAGPGAGGAIAEGEDVVAISVCSVRVTTSWPRRLTSRPSSSPSLSGALMPAAQTVRSARTVWPLAVRIMPGATSATVSPIISFTPSLVSSSAVAVETRSCKAGKMRGPAWWSRPMMPTSCRGSSLCKPYADSTCAVLRNSADSSTPVAPPPTIAT